MIKRFTHYNGLQILCLGQACNKKQSLAAGSSLLCALDDWIKGQRGQPYTMVKLQPSTAHSALQTYTITVQTSDVRGAGTNGDVSVVLQGQDGCTGDVPQPLQRCTHGSTYKVPTYRSCDSSEL